MGLIRNRQIYTICTLAIISFGLVMTGCGENKDTSDATTGTPQFTDNSGDATLLSQNREALALLEDSIQTAEEVLALLKTITDDESAEEALPQLEAFARQVRSEQEEWMFTSQGTILFANTEAQDAWQASSQTFEDLRDPLLSERYRIKDASDGSARSPMMRSFYAFKFVPSTN